jgi:hypothetical protein
MNDTSPPPVLSALVAAAAEMTDVELMMTMGAILAVLRNRMGVPRVKGAIEAAVKAMEKLQ